LPKKSSKVAVERDGDNASSPYINLWFYYTEAITAFMGVRRGGKTGISPLEILGLRSKNF